MAILVRLPLQNLIFFFSKERAADGGMKAVDFEDAGCFQNELLDQSMKLSIGNDTRQIRELIVTRALYSAFILQEESEEKKTVQMVMCISYVKKRMRISKKLLKR